jgi:hypothetical protein
MIAFSALSTFQVRLPAGDDSTSILHLNIYIRDDLECITEYNISSIFVTPDTVEINNLINAIQNSASEIATNPVGRLLASGNQNTVGQVITSLSQQFNKMNSESVDKAISSKLDVFLHYSDTYLFFRWSSSIKYCYFTIRKSKFSTGNFMQIEFIIYDCNFRSQCQSIKLLWMNLIKN